MEKFAFFIRQEGQEILWYFGSIQWSNWNLARIGFIGSLLHSKFGLGLEAPKISKFNKSQYLSIFLPNGQKYRLNRGEIWHAQSHHRCMEVCQFSLWLLKRLPCQYCSDSSMHTVLFTKNQRGKKIALLWWLWYNQLKTAEEPDNIRQTSNLLIMFKAQYIRIWISSLPCFSPCMTAEMRPLRL